MSVKTIADAFTALCKAGRLEEAGEVHWADDVVSIESETGGGDGGGGDMRVLRGKQAVKAKSDWWNNAHDMHSFSCEGPYLNGDQFALEFQMDVTHKESGQRIQMREMALYTVKGGKIVEERFFY